MARCRPLGLATVPASAGATAASRPSTATGRLGLFANIAVSRSTNAKGAVFFDMQPLPELAELRDAVYVAGKKVLSDDYLKRLTPLSLAIWYMDDGGFTLRSKGLQQRTEGGSGRSEICVEAMSPDTQRAAPALPRRHVGHRGRADRPGHEAEGRSPVPDCRDGEAACAARAVHPSDDAVQAAARSTRVGSRRRAGLRAAAPSAGADDDHRASRSSRRPEHASLRPRGRGHAQLLRRRRDGAQLARDDPWRAGAEVLFVGAARHPPDRVHEGRRRGRRQPHARSRW